MFGFQLFWFFLLYLVAAGHLRSRPLSLTFCHQLRPTPLHLDLPAVLCIWRPAVLCMRSTALSATLTNTVSIRKPKMSTAVWVAPLLASLLCEYLNHHHWTVSVLANSTNTSAAVSVHCKHCRVSWPFSLIAAQLLALWQPLSSMNFIHFFLHFLSTP